MPKSTSSQRKIPIAVWVALIGVAGVAVTAIANSQVIIEWLKRTPVVAVAPTETPAPPTLTYTSTPTSTPTSTKTPLPPPLAEIFPQAGDGETFVFVNPPGLLTDRFVQNCVHSGPYGLRLNYEFSGVGNGGWGVSWENAPTSHFDASVFTALVFWVKGASGNEIFQVGLKDTSEKEVKVEAKPLVVNISDWTQITISMSKFKGVKTDLVRNVNFGFNLSHGSGSICIDDIAFVKQ